jgi:pyruvate/2-oxoglutarate dehydrogenase complex dihydrolipoamide acyltransferase (E2) component
MPQLYVTMPQPGETIAEGTIVSWTVKAGDMVEESQPLAELETEKAVFEYESPFEGKVIKLMHDSGARVKVAHPIAIIEVDEEKAKVYAMMGLAKYVDGDEAPASTPADNEAAKKETPTQTTAATKTADLPKVEHVKMSPAVRKLAKQKGLNDDDLRGLAALSSDGRVTKDAIDGYKPGSKPATQSAPVSSKQEFETVVCSPIRMRIADNMVLSKSKIPHAHNGIAVDITKIVEFRDAHKADYKNKNGVNLNFLSLVYKALTTAIHKYPVINASYVDTKEPHEIRLFKSVNLGIACGTEHGLMIPVVHDISRLGFKEFNESVNDKVGRAQKKKLMPKDMEGATIIFNNYGFFGTQLGVQVIQYPMACTLGMSAIEKRVVPVGTDGIGVRTMCDFVLSFDHRVMDGRETGLFLGELKKQIESIDLRSLSV